MTTIKPAVDLAARAAVAARTEELFRASGAFREGHFLLKSGRHGDAYVEKFAVLSDPAATSELCGFWAARIRGLAGSADRPIVDLVAGPTTGGIILAFETARQLGLRSIFAEEVRAADGGSPPRVPTRVHDPARRTGLARRRHPDHRRLVARDDPGGRGARRRDRGMRGVGRPQRRPGDADLADDGADVPAPVAVAARPADLRARRGDLPALRGGGPTPRAGQHRTVASATSVGG